MVGFTSFGQNMLDMSAWTIGSGSISGFNQNGTTSENSREWGVGPLGNRVILWKASPDAVSGADGGWNTDNFSIDHTKMYRLSIWIKKTNSNVGATYFGPRSLGANLLHVNTGVEFSNPYFFSSDLPQLDKWYLLVSYVHGSGDNSTAHLGEIYDADSGASVVGLRDFKFQTSTSHLRHRTYLYYDTNTSDRQYFYAPRVDEVNGDEPTITDLLGIQPISLNQLSVGTDEIPAGYTLSVGGDAIMEKVKVQPETAWPDYVFKKEYPLLGLKELKAFINKNGHLPNMPSAKEIKNNNQDLGLIQQKLLEKIEELTLYIIEQNIKDLLLEDQNKNLKIRYTELQLRMKEIEKQNKEILKALKIK